MPQRGTFDVAEANETARKIPYCCSARMTYAICAFLAMLLHHCMRSAVNYSILCMVSNGRFETDSAESEIGAGVSPCAPQRNVSSAVDQTATQTTLHLGDLTWTRNQEVMFQGVFFYGAVIAMPIGGFVADKYGGKFLFVSSLVLEALVFMLIPICCRTHFWLGSAARFIQGLIAGAGAPAMYQLFTVWSHPTERTASLTFGYSGFTIANLIIYPLATYLCGFGWDTVFYIIGAASFLIGISFQWLVYNSIDAHPRISKEERDYLKVNQKPKRSRVKIPWKSILRSVPVYIFILTHFCHTFSSSMEALMLPRFLKEALLFKLNHVGHISAIVFMGSLLAKIVTFIVSLKLESNTRLNLNLYRKVLHMICAFICVALFIGIVFLECEQRWIAVAFWTINSFFMDVSFSAAYWPSIIFLSPSYSGFLIGIANCIGTSAAIFVPLLISYVAPNGTPAEWDIVIAILGAVLLIDGLAFGIFGSSKLQPWDSERDSIDNGPAIATTQSPMTSKKQAEK